jgi:hypothetical protein
MHKITGQGLAFLAVGGSSGFSPSLIILILIVLPESKYRCVGMHGYHFLNHQGKLVFE